MTAPTRRSTDRPSPNKTSSRITDADKAAVKSSEATLKALAYAGRVAEQQILCPDCGTWRALKNKFKIFPDGGWKDHAGGCHGDAIKVLQAAPTNLGYVDAVCLLVDKPVYAKVPPPPKDLPDITIGAFKATIDQDVFDGLFHYARNYDDAAAIKAAIEFYGQWHISPASVLKYGAALITDPAHLAAALVDKFGVERLVACGLFSIGKNDRPFSLIGEKWPVLEPHRHPGTGRVLYMQMRASNEQNKLYLEHKAGKRAYEGSQKFLSLRGAPSSAQIGVGLDVIDKLEPGSTIYIVEGYKDVLAADTMGRVAYGIPGVSFRPNAKICALLARHDVVVCLDGDEAGHKGTFGTVELEPLIPGDKAVQVAANAIPPGAPVRRIVEAGLVEHLRKNGVRNVRAQPLTGGMDITDRLVANHASNGCTCAACRAFAARAAA